MSSKFGDEIVGKVLAVVCDGIENPEAAFHPEVAHTRGLAVLDVDPAVARHALERFTESGACDAQLSGEFTFGGEEAVDGHLSAEDGLNQAIFGKCGRSLRRFPLHTSPIR